MAGDSGSGNSRVTNAILATKLDALTDKVDQYHDEIVDVSTTVTGLQIVAARHDERINANEREIEAQKRRGLLWDTLNSAGALGSFILGKIT